MPMTSATFPTKKEAEGFGNRAFANPKVKKTKDGWEVWNERPRKVRKAKRDR